MMRAVDKVITLLTKVCCPVSRRLSVMLEQGDLFPMSLDHSFKTSEKIRHLREAHEKSLNEMEELERFRGSTFETLSRRKLIEDRDTILELTGKIQELPASSFTISPRLGVPLDLCIFGALPPIRLSSNDRCPLMMQNELLRPSSLLHRSLLSYF